MSLTADKEYKTMGHVERLYMKGGDADTLYKGAILNIDAAGYMEVPSDAASVIPFGVCVKQVVEDGTHLAVEVERGIIGVPKRTQQVTTVTFVDGGTSNADLDGEYFDIYNGSAGYRVWFNVNSGDNEPDDGGLTLVEVAVSTINTEAEIAAACEVVIDALTGIFTSTDTAEALAITSVTAGYSAAPSKSATLADGTMTLAETYIARAVQSDIGEIFFAIADDGVVYSTGKSTADMPAGLCLGFESRGVLGEDADILYIDFRRKALS